MEILNPYSEKLKERHDKSQVFISFRTKETGLSFSKAAMSQLILKPGIRITFVIDIDRLYFYIAKKEGDGFLLTEGRHEGGIISSRLLVRHIYARLPAAKRNGTRYGIRLSQTQINDCITFEILLNNRL